jgi:hypothetical protein
MNVEEAIDTYCRAWSDPNPQARADFLAQVWSPGATYTDPTVHAANAAELLAHIDGVVRKRPGARVIRTSEIGMHHGIARFEWCVELADGQRLPTGLDIAYMRQDGKIERIIGFFGGLQPLA